MPIEIPLRKKYYTGEQIKDILDDFITDVSQEIKMLERFADLPTADVVEVVRCKDCEYFVDEMGWAYCGMTYLPTEEDGFCKWGERREDGES